VLAELAGRAEMEEPGLCTTAGAVDPDVESVARAAVALQVVVALGDAKRRHFLLVAFCQRPQHVEGIARLRIAGSAEQSLRATELHLVARRSLVQRFPPVERADLAGCDRCQIAERELVIDARVRLGGAAKIAGRLPRAGATNPPLIGRERFLRAQRLVVLRRILEPPLLLRHFAGTAAGRIEQVATGRTIDQRTEDRLRLVQAPGAKGEQSFVVLPIRRQRSTVERRLRERCGGLGVLGVFDQACRTAKRGHRRGRAAIWHQPHIRDLARQRRMRSGGQRRRQLVGERGRLRQFPRANVRDAQAKAWAYVHRLTLPDVRRPEL
jgi:hypothetical protein